MANNENPTLTGLDDSGKATEPKTEKPKASKPKAEKPKASKLKTEKPKAEKWNGERRLCNGCKSLSFKNTPICAKGETVLRVSFNGRPLFICKDKNCKKS